MTSTRGASMPPLISGRFTIESEAGSGGMGVVYRGFDTATGQSVAIKVMQHAESASTVERFLREAQLLRELRHPGIVGHIEHGRTEQGRPYLVMEWLAGEDLAQHLEHHRLRLRETLALLRGVAEALAFAHGKGVVHRELMLPSRNAVRFFRAVEVARKGVRVGCG